MSVMFEHLTEEQREVLHARAQTLAAVNGDDRTDDDAVTVAILELAPNRYGVGIQHVQEIEPLRSITPVPGLPEHWSGIVNLRGSMFAVLDLRKYLRLPPVAQSAEKPKIVRVTASGLTVGLLVDAVDHIQEVPLSHIAPSPRPTNGVRTEAIRGVTPELLTILDLDGLLSDPMLPVGTTAGEA